MRSSCVGFLSVAAVVCAARGGGCGEVMVVILSLLRHADTFMRVRASAFVSERCLVTPWWWWWWWLQILESSQTLLTVLKRESVGLVKKKQTSS